MLNRVMKLACMGIFAAALASGSVAFAQDDEFEESGEFEDEFGEEGDEFGEEGDEIGEEGDEAEVGEEAGVASGAYPVEYLARPRVLPKGAWEAGVDLAMNNDFSAIALGNMFMPYQGGLSFVYGLGDKLNVGASYGFALKDFEAKGNLNALASYLVMDEGSLVVRADGSLGYSFLFEDFGPISAGAMVQYSLGDKMAVFARPALIVLPEIVLIDGAEAVRPMFLSVPASFGYQVNQNVYVEAGLQLANIEVSDTETQIIFADFLPVTVAGMYAVDNTLDVGASLGIDLQADSVGDSLLFGLMARYRGGV